MNMSPLEIWLKSTYLSHMMHTWWAWRTAESLHFFGLSLLLGTVGIFDLRLLGFARQISLPALHRLIPFGIFGYFINVVTGISFFVGEPDQYLYNPSFQIKMVFMTLAGINVLLFYFHHVSACEDPRARRGRSPPGEDYWRGGIGGLDLRSDLRPPAVVLSA